MRNHLVGLAVMLGIAACGDNLKARQDDAGIDAPGDLCGNGAVDGNEQCDDGDANGGPDARCTTSCQWVCLDDTWCADQEACNGAETCVEHRCVAGSQLDDGTMCGDGKLCRNGSCTDSVCGDMFVTSPGEECDDANSAPGDGCENNCKYSCLSTDVTRNCTPTDICAGQGTCNDQTHQCTPGTPLDDNTPCGTGKYCKQGTCTTAMCGNGVVEPGELCDNGSANGMPGNGCKANCTFACAVPATDCPAPPACQIAACNPTTHVCETQADPTQENMPCGNGNVCKAGSCVPPTSTCGNGVTEVGEDCDFGAGNGADTGCESNCKFSCTKLPDSCNDNNPCNGTETCTTVTVQTRTGQKCTATAAPAPGTSCGTNQICLGQVCVASTCGDGFVDAGRGETCEPPNQGNCDAQCHSVVCGDGVRAGIEQCDDSNTTNLDGCDSTCKFEQCHRVNSLAMVFNTNQYCTANRLGAAIVGSIARDQITGALTNGVNDGSITIELKALGLDDLTGTADPTLSLGILTGSPVTGTGYNGANDLDWWYLTSSMVIDSQRNPTSTVPASIAAKALSAGPADISITVSLAGVPAALDMRSAKLRASLGAATTPLSSTGAPPGHLASEHLDPALQSFATASGGELCGNVVSRSLRNVPIPSALTGCGTFNCSRCYTTANSLLDVIVGGCSITFVGTQIAATQPDVGGGYAFQTNATTKIVTGCTRNGQPAQLDDCLASSAYSSFFRFTTDRVIAK